MIQDPARIERALRKAHEAGDTESAKKLAAAYKQAMAGTSPPAQTPPADPFASAPPNGGEGQQASAGQPLAPSTSPTGQAGALGGQPRPSAPGGQSLGVGSFSPRPPRGFGGLSLSEPPRTISSSLRLPVSREDIKREKEEGLLYLPPGMDGPVDTGSDFNLDQFAATRRQEQDAQFAQDQQALLATRKNPESRPFSEYQQYQNLSDPTGVGNVPVQDTRKQYVIEDYIESLIPEKREYMDTKVAAGKWTDEDAARMEMAAFSRQAEIVEARIADLDARYKSLQPIDPADVEDIKAQAQYVQSQVDQDFRAIVQRHPEMARELLEDKAVAQMKDVRRSVDPAYSVMYEGIINPAARAWARFGANILRTPRTFSFDDAYGWTDQLAEYAESVMDKADRRQPAAFQGPLVEEGKVHAERLLPKVSETIASSLLLVGGGGGFLPGLVANSFVQTNSDYFKEAVDAGATASQGGIYAAQASTVTSLLEGLSPQNYLFRQGLRTIGKQAVREMVGGKSLSEAFKRAKFVGKEIAEENVQEISQMVGDKLSASWGNAWLRVDNPGFSQALDDEYSMDEFMETVILTTAMSGLMSAPRAVGSNPVHAEAVQWAVENPDLFELALAKSEIPDADRLKAMDRLAQYSRAFKGMKPTGDAVRDKTIADAVLEKEKIKEEQGQTLVDDVVAAIAGNKFEERLKEQDQIIAQATGTTLADVIKKQEIAKLQEQYDKAKLKSEVTGKPMPEGGQVAPIPAAAQPEGPVRPEAKPGHQEQPATDAGTETVPAQEEGAGADIPDTVRGRKQVRKGLNDLRENRRRQKEAQENGEKVNEEKMLFERIDIAQSIRNNTSRSEGAITPEEQAEVDAVMQEAKDAGYTIEDPTGKDWSGGLKATAEFIPDDTLEPLPDGKGRMVIDKVRQPFIFKDGKMVRAADVVVRQGPPGVPKSKGSPSIADFNAANPNLRDINEADFEGTEVTGEAVTQPAKKATPAPPAPKEAVAEEGVSEEAKKEVASIVRSAYGNVMNLAGPSNAGHRQRILELLTGAKPPKAKAGINAVEEALFNASKAQGASTASKRDAMYEWLGLTQKEEAPPTPKAPEGEKKTTPTPQDTPAPPKPTTKAKITDPVVSTMVRSTESGSVEVTGQEYELPGFPQERFILHKDPDGPGWRVSESSTGMAIWAGATKAEALEAAQQRLSKVTPEKLRRAIEVQKLAQQQGPMAQMPGRIANEKDLIIQHNLSEENLLNAARIGGLPVPSLAITNVNQPPDGFGEITLIGPVEEVEAGAATEGPGFKTKKSAQKYADRHNKGEAAKPWKVHKRGNLFVPVNEAAAEEKIYSEFGKRSTEEEERSRADSRRLSEEFEARQEEFRRTMPDGDAVIERIEEKMAFGHELTPDELVVANEQFYRPSGYDFDKGGGLVKARKRKATSRPKEPAPRKTPKKSNDGTSRNTGKVRKAKATVLADGSDVDASPKGAEQGAGVRPSEKVATQDEPRSDVREPVQPPIRDTTKVSEVTPLSPTPPTDTGAATSVPVQERSTYVQPELTKDVADAPAALAEAYLTEREDHTSEGNELSAFHSALAGRVKQDSYNSFGDRNKVTVLMAKNYFSKKGKKGQGLDQIAQELSEQLGREVTPGELASFMENFPSGLPQRSDRMVELSDRYRGITGKKMNALVAKGILGRNKGRKGQRLPAKNTQWTPEEQAIVDEANQQNWPVEEATNEDLSITTEEAVEDVFGPTPTQEEVDAIFGPSSNEGEGSPRRSVRSDTGADTEAPVGTGTQGSVQGGGSDAGASRTDKGRGDRTPGEGKAGNRSSSQAERDHDTRTEELRAEVRAARAALDKATADFNERGQALFDESEGSATPGLFEGDTRQNTQEDFGRIAKPLRERVAQAEQALKEHEAGRDAFVAKREQEIAAQGRVDEVLPTDADPLSQGQAAQLVNTEETRQLLQGSVIEGRIDPEGEVEGDTSDLDAAIDALPEDYTPDPEEQRPIEDTKPQKYTGKPRTDRILNALRGLAPDLRITIAESPKHFAELVKGIGKEGIASSWGVYHVDANGKAHIIVNPASPDIGNTLFHEAAHPVIAALYHGDPARFNRFYDEVVMEAGGKYAKFGQRYADQDLSIQQQEALVQFIADVASGKIPVSTRPQSLYQKFKELLKDLMAALGYDIRKVDLSKPDNVRAFAGQVAKALNKGIKIVGLEGVTEGGPMMQIADIKGAVNIFGVDAVERDLATASNMEEGGKSPESIKLATGWERGVDGKWFYEIPDASLKDADTFAKALLSGKFDAESTIKDHFDAEEIFEAYPEIADYKIRIINEPSVGAEAEYSPIDKAITLNAARFIEEFKGRTPREVVARTNGMRGLRKVVAHELAHAVQDVSGFAAGGSPYMFDFVPADKRDATKVRELLSEYLEMTPEQKSERFGNLVAEGMTYWGPEKPEHQLRSLIDTSKTRVANAWGGEAKFLEWQVRLIDSLLRLPKWYMTSRQRYEALAGEVQARAVSAALDQSEQQRRSRTLKSLGSVPPEQQVVLSETPGTQAMMQKPSGATDAQWAGAVDAAVQAYTDSILEGNEDAQSLKAAMAAAAKTKGWGEMTKEARVAADRELRSMFEKASASQEKGTPSISGRRLRAEKEPTPKEKADIIAERLKHTPEKQDDVAGEVNSIIDQAFSDGMTLQQVEELIEAADTSPSNKMYARGRLHFEADKAAHDRALSQAERLEAAELSARMVNRMAKFGMEGGRANAMFYRVMKDFSTFSFDVNLKAAQQKADKLFNTPVEGVPLKDRIAEIQAALKKALAEDGDLSNAIGLIGKLNDILDQYATDLSKTTLKPGQHQDTSLAEAVRSPSKFAAKIRALEEALRAAKEDLARMKKNGRPQDVIDKAGARVEEIEKLRAELESLREGIKEERKEYDEKLTQYERLIAELVNRNIPKTKDGPLSSGKVQSKAVKALLEASLAGVMTQDFYKNLSEAFGLPYITPQMRAVLRALSDAVHEFQKGGQRELARRAMRALNTQVRKMTPKDAEFYYTLFDEMLHTNILSGINTFFNANQGSLFESMYAFAGLNISHLAKGNFGALAYAYGKLLRPEGLRTGRNKALNYTMAYDDLGSYFEGEAKRGMGAYEEFLKLGVAQGLAMAKDGEMKKGVTRLIGSLMLQGVNFAFNIRAIDAMLTHSFAEFQYALKDYDKIMKEMGVSNHMSPVAQVLSRMNPVPALKKLSQDGVQYQAALDQARKEVKDLKARGFKIGRYGFVMATKAINEKLAERWVNGYIKRRAQEILENDRDHDAMNSAIRMGKDSILMGDPDGVSGWLSERVASAFSTNKFNQASTPGKMAMVAFRATGLFFRVMANTWGRAVHNTPVIGAIAATYGLSKDPKTDKWTFGALWKRDPQRFKLRLASNALASAFVLAAWNMMFDLADDDDDDEDVKKIPFLGTRMKLNPDRLIDLTANAYSRYDKNMGISEDYQMFSIRFRTPEQAKAGEWGTPWLSMRLIPSLGGPLATVGRMADDVKGYGGLKEGEEENLSQRIRRETKWGTAAFGVLGQSSFNAIGRTVNKFNYASDIDQAYAGVIQDIALSPVTAMAQPTFYRDVINEAMFLADKPAKQRRRVHGMADLPPNFFGSLYGLDNLLFEDKVDRFGNPVPRVEKFSDNLKAFTGYQSNADRYPEVALLFKYEDLPLPAPDYRPRTIAGNEPDPRKPGSSLKLVLTGEEKERINAYHKQFLRAIVRMDYLPDGEWEGLETLGRDDLSAYLKNATLMAKEFARAQLVAERDGDTEVAKAIVDANEQAQRDLERIREAKK